jgi:hypothetical protein
VGSATETLLASLIVRSLTNRNRRSFLSLTPARKWCESCGACASANEVAETKTLVARGITRLRTNERENIAMWGPRTLIGRTETTSEAAVALGKLPADAKFSIKNGFKLGEAAGRPASRGK